ncbi:hypothetical protein LUZ60_005347 [Juncus effusus]|nr:hypothetical protein LUZ60_005347 [Juncus effusus]
MDLETIKDSFEKVAEKQKQSTLRTEQLIDRLIGELDYSISQLNSSTDQSSILTQLKSRISEIAPLAQLESSQKDLNLALAKYVKTLEKTFNTDISKAYRDINMDFSTINEIIASHFYRQGQFELGDSFSQSAQVANSDSLKAPFIQLHSILESIKSGNLIPAISWAEENRESLSHSSLELNLHKFQFLQILKSGNQDSALSYARSHLSRFALNHKSEIQKLIALLLWTNRLDQSPYATSLTSNYSDLANEFAREYSSTLNQPYIDPLQTVINAGSEGLPTLLKLSTVMASTKKEEWKEMKQLPVPLDISKEFSYHSVFVCPVLREQAGGEENPPMLMPCGHVLSRQSIVKLSKNSTRGFKCPYCPMEASVGQCKQLHF